LLRTAFEEEIEGNPGIEAPSATFDINLSDLFWALPPKRAIYVFNKFSARRFNGKNPSIVFLARRRGSSPVVPRPHGHRPGPPTASSVHPGKANHKQLFLLEPKGQFF